MSRTIEATHTDDLEDKAPIRLAIGSKRTAIIHRLTYSSARDIISVLTTSVINYEKAREKAKLRAAKR